MTTISRPKVIWFNKGLSSVGHAASLIKSAFDDVEIICSHTNPNFVGFEYSDISRVEPIAMGADEYVTYALSMCDELGVDVFWPSRFQGEIVAQIDLFKDRGITVVSPCDYDTLLITEDKASLYAVLEDIAPIPQHFLVNSYKSFWYGYQAIKAEDNIACIKPTKGIFAQGFRKITEGKCLLSNILRADEFTIDFVSLNACLKSYEEADSFPQPILLMQFLSGVELSCDCVASYGELSACVIREKPQAAGKGQLIVDNPQVELVISDIAKVLNLSGPFNIQFKYQDGEPYLLEINPRLSGGIHMSCESGVNLPAIAVSQALGKGDIEIPEPKYGLRVHDFPRQIVSTTGRVK